jgi:hypothetical protein
MVKKSSGIIATIHTGILNLSKCNRRFCRRYKQTIVRKARRFEHESRNGREGAVVICAGES